MKLTAKAREYGFSLCRKCRSVVPLDDFRQWNDGAERAMICRKCETGIEWKRAAGHGAVNGAAWVAKRAMIDAAKDVRCADCGRRFPPVCMDFDHLEQSDKKYNISALAHHREDTILAEIAKCDVVCACCHRIRTAKRGYIKTGRPVKVATGI